MINKTHIAIAYCKKCGDKIMSRHGGEFVGCKCGESHIDQERFDGRYVRLIGEAELIIHICPGTCKNKEHKGNKKY